MKSPIVITIALLSILVISCQKEAVLSNSQKLTLDGLASSSNKTAPVPKSITIKDINGNTYKVVTIGSQKWIASNLNTSKYRNGDLIPEVKDPAIWSQLTTGAWCYYNNDPANGPIYGKLYNWYAVNDPRGLAPKLWHVATDAEWNSLDTYLGASDNVGGALKEAGIAHWCDPNVGATNSSGFTALPGGYFNSKTSTFYDQSGYGLFWTATEYNTSEAWLNTMICFTGIKFREYNTKQNALSVRCIKN